GESDEAAWRASFGDTNIDERYTNHLTESYEFMRYPLSLESNGAPIVAELDPTEVALALSTFYDWSHRSGAKPARLHIDAARKASPDSADPLLYLAALHADRRRWRKSRRSLDRAATLEPANPDVLAAGLQLYSAQRGEKPIKGADSRRLHSWALELRDSATSAFHYVALSTWHSLHGDPHDALRLAERAIELDPRSAAAEVAAADAAMDLGRTDVGQKHLRAALGLTEHTDEASREALQSRLDALGDAADEPPW
ncbi:MAG: hypothetical protein AAF997_02690, partial [Myxococcota bacterium]